MTAEIRPLVAERQTIQAFARRTEEAWRLLAVMRACNEEIREAALQSRRLMDESKALLRDARR